jgi:hypothetical protein
MDEKDAVENTRPLGNVDPLPTREELIEQAAVEAMRGYEPARTTRVVPIHDPSLCEGRPCPFHHPSDHHMVKWTRSLRLDKQALTERICEHGVGHPDPDSLAYYKSLLGEREASALAIHGCDGCCDPPS